MKTLKCIKQYIGDREQYGIDFIKGRIYNISDIEKDGSIYINSESGSSVLFENMNEIRNYFVQI